VAREALSPAHGERSHAARAHPKGDNRFASLALGRSVCAVMRWQRQGGDLTRTPSAVSSHCCTRPLAVGNACSKMRSRISGRETRGSKCSSKPSATSLVRAPRNFLNEDQATLACGCFRHQQWLKSTKNALLIPILIPHYRRRQVVVFGENGVVDYHEPSSKQPKIRQESR
jgi:hypothetical protein